MHNLQFNIYMHDFFFFNEYQYDLLVATFVCALTMVYIYGMTYDSRSFGFGLYLCRSIFISIN